MKTKNKLTVLFLAVFLCLSLSGISVYAGAAYSSASKADTGTAVNNYNDFFNCLTNAVNSKAGTVTMKVAKYDKNTYDVPAALTKILSSGKSLKYSIFQYKVTTSTKGSTATMKVELKYEAADRLAGSYNEFYQAVRDAAVNLQDVVKLRISNYDPNIYKASAVLEQKTKDNGELYYLKDLKTTWTKAAVGTSGVLTVNLVYSSPKAELTKMKQAMDSKLEEIFKKAVSPDMSGNDKELALHDYLIGKTQFTPGKYYFAQADAASPYSVLVNGKGNSLGIASAMQLLLKKAGLESIIVTGDSEAWNIVKVDGQYYHLDTAADFWECDGKSYAAHDYFNVTDEEISKTHSWDKALYPKCTSTGSNYFVKNKTIANNTEEYYELVKNSIEEVREYVSIKMPNYSEAAYNISDAIKQISNEHPDMDYVNEWQWQINDDLKVINLVISYDYPRDQLLAMKKETADKVKEIVKNLITPGMSDYQKELALHNYVINNARYDYENVDKDAVPFDEHDAYGVLIKGIGVCDSYAEAMKMLLNEAGVECLVAEGDAISSSGSEDTKYGHAWNIIKLDGEYYHFDATWDDVKNEDGSESLTYYFLNLTDDEARSLYTWDESKYPKCTGTKYNYYTLNNQIINSSTELQSSITKAFNKRAGGLNVKITNYKNSGISIEDVIKNAFYNSSLRKLNGASWRTIPELGIVEIRFEY